MTTRLTGALKREFAIGASDYTLTLTEEGFTLTLKGKRKGLDIRWKDLVSGDAALATALNASLTAPLTVMRISATPRGTPAKTRGGKPARAKT